MINEVKSMTIDEKIKQTKIAIAKTKSEYCKRDLNKYLKKLKAQKYKNTTL